jgi:hypothetical protein
MRPVEHDTERDTHWSERGRHPTDAVCRRETTLSVALVWPETQDTGRQAPI